MCVYLITESRYVTIPDLFLHVFKLFGYCMLCHVVLMQWVCSACLRKWYQFFFRKFRIISGSKPRIGGEFFTQNFALLRPTNQRS